MAQRYTDSQKWEDEWFTELPNDFKVIWFYLLDTCDNAGIWKQNIKLLNFSCSTNTTLNELAEVFKGRITKIDTDKWIINKFCVFQYGVGFLQSGNKAVISAIKKLITAGVLDVDSSGKYIPKILFDNSIDTLSIPYQYTTDSIKDKEQDKVKDKIKDIDKEQDKTKIEEYCTDCIEATASEVFIGSIDKEQDKTKAERQDMLAETFDNIFKDV